MFASSTTWCDYFDSLALHESPVAFRDSVTVVAPQQREPALTAAPSPSILPARETNLTIVAA